VDNNASILETIMGYIKPYLLLKVTGDLPTQGQVSVVLFLSCWSIFTSFICQTLSIKGRNERNLHMAGNQRRVMRRMDRDTERNGGFPRVTEIGKLIVLSI